MPKNEFHEAHAYDAAQEPPLSALPCGVCVAAPDARCTIRHANEYFWTMFGYPDGASAAEAGFACLTDRIDADSRLRACEAIDRFLSGGASVCEVEARQRRRDGTHLWTLMRMRRANRGGDLVCVLVDVTAQKTVEEELRSREEEYRIATQQSDKLVFRYDILGKTAYLTPESAERFGVSCVSGLPESLADMGVVKDDSLEAYYALYAAICDGERSSGSALLQLRLAPVGYEWFQVDYSLLFDREGSPAQAVLSLKNASMQREKELAYKRWQQAYAAMPQESIVYLEFDLTHGRFERQEGGLLEPFPENMEPTLEAALRYAVMHWAHEEDREALLSFASRERLMTSYFRGIREETFEYRHIRLDGNYRWVRIDAQMLPDPYSSDVKAFFLLRDIDAQKCEELSLKDRARTDALTGVLNRETFADRVNALCLDARPDRFHVLVITDVDHFKHVNDQFGHSYGDRVLTRIAEAFRAALRADDLVGRLGGDEFLLLLRGVGSRDALAAKLASLSEQVYRCAGNGRRLVSCSFGAACCPADGRTFEELYLKADAALYAAKQAGRNCARIYEPGIRLQERPEEIEAEAAED